MLESTEMVFTNRSHNFYLQLGVNLVERSKSRQVLKQFTLRELDRWGYKPGVLFYFEVKLDRKDPTSIEFGTRDGLKMANLLTDYAHALIQEAEFQKVRRLSQSVQQDLDADERNLARLSVTKNSKPNLKSDATKAVPPAGANQPVPPPPPPPPPKRNSLPNGLSFVQEKSSKPHRASFTSPPPPPPKKIEPAAGAPTPKPLPGLSDVPPAARLSVRGAPTAPPPPPPPPKSANRPPSQRVTSAKLQYTPHHHQCATIIQSNYRGYALRSAWIKEDAAILIQSVYRGYAERCRVALMLEEMYRSGQLELLDDDS